MKVVVLSSGSKGNTTYIESGDTKILIDLGNSCKYVKDKLDIIGVEAKDIDAIFLTHTHADHIKGLKVFTKRFGTKVYLTKGMLEDLDYLENYSIINDKIIEFKNIALDIIKTSHDAKDPVGYIINGNNKSIVYITDTGYINQKYFDLLSNRDIYILESNHDIEMLNNGPYPFHLRQRILGDKGHLSNYDSSKYLSTFLGSRTKYIVLAHLSEENNTINLAYNTLKERLDNNNQIVDKIIVATQNEETEMLEI